MHQDFMVQKLLDGWVIRAGINSFLNSFVMVNLFVAVWGGETTVFQRAVVAILMESVGVFWSGVGESRNVRKFVMTNFICILWISAAVDLLLTPLYFYSAYIYFVIFIISLDGVYSLLFLTSTNDVREVLILDANARNSYIPRVNKVRGVANISGAVITILFPISEWNTWWMFSAIMLCVIGTTLTTTIIFRKTIRYMKQTNLLFPCQQTE